MFDQQVTFLYTRDLEASAAFYSETLGLPLALDQGGCRIFKTSPQSFLGVCRCSELRPSSPEGVIVTLVTDDVDGWHERLRAKGATIDAAPIENPEYNIFHFFLSDPDGYKIEIQSFRDPRWPRPA